MMVLTHVIYTGTHSGDDVRRDKEESAVCNII